MSGDERDRALREILERIAPGAGAESIAADASLRRELDLDSMDFLEFCVAVERRFGVAIPEVDYSRVTTIAECIGYIGARVPKAAD